MTAEAVRPAVALAAETALDVEGLVAGTAPFSAVDGPGNRFVVFLQGCGWDCLACHNPATIPLQPKGSTPTTVGALVAEIAAAAPFLTGVTVTGGEPTLQAGFVEALFVALAADPATAQLSRFVDSNGDAPLPVWERLVPLTDGFMIDLKALDAERHVVLTGHANRHVLASLARLAALRALYEVRLLLVPGLNDDDATLTRTAHWLLSLDPQLRVRVNGFRRQGSRACARELLEVTAADRDRYRAVLLAAGVTRLTGC
jgi:pyruvate-formate lyase-activating enzyme